MRYLAGLFGGLIVSAIWAQLLVDADIASPSIFFHSGHGQWIFPWIFLGGPVAGFLLAADRRKSAVAVVILLMILPTGRQWRAMHLIDVQQRTVEAAGDAHSADARRLALAAFGPGGIDVKMSGAVQSQGPVPPFAMGKHPLQYPTGIATNILVRVASRERQTWYLYDTVSRRIVGAFTAEQLLAQLSGVIPAGAHPAPPTPNVYTVSFFYPLGNGETIGYIELHPDRGLRVRVIDLPATKFTRKVDIPLAADVNAGGTR